MPRANFFAICALFLASQASLPARSWEVLEGCEYWEGAHSDGDSIEVRRRGKHHVFRLYFVDCLEKNPVSRARRRVQAQYFGLKGSEGAALRAAYLARNFTKSKLREPFTVYTRWEPVESGGDNPAVRAFLKTAGDEDLSWLLVHEGLAIIRHGDTAISDHPDGTRANEISSDLREAEREAQSNKRGAWGLANSSREVSAKDFLMAMDREALISRAGTRAKVRGRVSRIGELRNGRLTFINFSGNRRDGFVGIVGRGGRSRFLKQFPQGLENALLEKDVVLEGVITLHRGTPQIELESPSQLQIDLNNEESTTGAVPAQNER
jgi:endonuclease YncB( thermonuclease family)